MDTMEKPPIGLTLAGLGALYPCGRRYRAVVQLLGGANAWGDNIVTPAMARAAGCPFDDIVWTVAAVSHMGNGMGDDVKRRACLWMADCAARVLPVYERQAPADLRVRDAITVARHHARGEVGRAALNAARAAAQDAVKDAAKDVTDTAVKGIAGTVVGNMAAYYMASAAWNAASAASFAASWHVSGDAANDAANAAAEDVGSAPTRDFENAMAWGAGYVAAKTHEAARRAVKDHDEARHAAKAREEAWQFGRLIARLSDPEPDDVPLPGPAVPG